MEELKKISHCVARAEVQKRKGTKSTSIYSTKTVMHVQCGQKFASDGVDKVCFIARVTLGYLGQHH